MSSKAPRALLVALCITVSAHAFGAATITIVNGDPAGVGFNDATVVAPVGGNTGHDARATAAQRLPGRREQVGRNPHCRPDDPRPRDVGSSYVHVDRRGPRQRRRDRSVRDFTGAPLAGHWYGKALTAKLFGADPDPATADIRARFNVNLGNVGCLDGVFFYLGLDNNHGTNVDLVTVLTHEFGHGLGFQTFTNGSTGAQFAGFPSIWDDFLLDTVDRQELDDDDQRRTFGVGAQIGQAGLDRRHCDQRGSRRAAGGNAAARRVRPGDHFRQLPGRHGRASERCSRARASPARS